jgi:adenylosuccinate synthase
MSVDILLGLQWGDEGKGKIIDVFAPHYDIVARFQGGPNAGHTLVIDGKKFVLHQIPSGIFHAHITCVIGNGVVLNPITLSEELEKLTQAGVDYHPRMLVSSRAHLIVPSHRLLDQALEQWKAQERIGTTLRGISPAYRDKVGRMGLRVADILGADFEQLFDRLLAYHAVQLQALGFEGDVQAGREEFLKAVDVLRSLRITDTEIWLNQQLQAGKRILAEGAQGTMLDIDFGSYPYVTGSNTVSAGACAGLGISPRHVRKIFGVLKAYSTRVGEGPFPTEQLGAEGEKLRQAGNEFGATTGRPRRCGWLDLPAIRYAALVNGTTHLIMTKADVLASTDEISVCTHYKINGELHELPSFTWKGEAEPVYTRFPSWPRNAQAGDVPEELRQYLDFVEGQIGIPIPYLSTGPDREHFIQLHPVD